MCVVTVSVVIVEDGHAGLGVPVELGLLPVVGLLDAQPPGVGPVVEGPAGVGGRHGHLGGGPEPAVDVLGEEVGPVAAVEVTKTARGPEVGHVGCNYQYSDCLAQEGRGGLLWVLPSINPLIQSYSCWVSSDTRSIHLFLQ